MITMEGISSDNYSKVAAEIQAMRGRIFQLGSFDSEDSDLNKILNKLQKRQITPEKALELAKGIEESRQDYH